MYHKLYSVKDNIHWYGLLVLYIFIFEKNSSFKKSLKMPKGHSESVNRRRDNKKDKITNNDLQSIHIDLKIE